MDNFRQQIPYLDMWLPEIKSRFSQDIATQIKTVVQQKYQQALDKAPDLKSRVLRNHLTGSILPVLSLYNAFQSVGLDLETALLETQRFFFLTLEQARSQQLSLGKLPIAYATYRVMIRPLMSIVFPGEGFNVEWIETSRDQLAFNMHGCFYLNMLTEYNAPELTQIFCNGDDYIYTDISHQISWQRTQTLGKGSSHCDFRFVRKRD